MTHETMWLITTMATIVFWAWFLLPLFGATFILKFEISSIYLLLWVMAYGPQVKIVTPPSPRRVRKKPSPNKVTEKGFHKICFYDQAQGQVIFDCLLASRVSKYNSQGLWHSLICTSTWCKISTTYPWDIEKTEKQFNSVIL